MRFLTEGVIVSSKPLGEKSNIIHCLTRDKGFLSGITNTSRSQKLKSCNTIGNLISINYYGREDALGKIAPEIIKPYTDLFLSSKSKLFGSMAICSILKFISGNNQGMLFQKDLFECVIAFLNNALQLDPQFSVQSSFVLTIKKILTETGYGFNLNQCVATGTDDISSLGFISPKSGGAVCIEAARPYADLLLPLPQFFITENPNDISSHQDIVNCLRILDRFIRKIQVSYAKILPKEWDVAKTLFSSNSTSSC